MSRNNLEIFNRKKIDITFIYLFLALLTSSLSSLSLYLSLSLCPSSMHMRLIGRLIADVWVQGCYRFRKSQLEVIRWVVSPYRHVTGFNRLPARLWNSLVNHKAKRYPGSWDVPSTCSLDILGPGWPCREWRLTRLLKLRCFLSGQDVSVFFLFFF